MLEIPNIIKWLNKVDVIKGKTASYEKKHLFKKNIGIPYILNYMKFKSYIKQQICKINSWAFSISNRWSLKLDEKLLIFIMVLTKSKIQLTLISPVD